MVNKVILNSWKLQYKNSYAEAKSKYNELCDEDKISCYRGSGFIKRLEPRALYQKYISIIDAFIEEYIRLKVFHPTTYQIEKINILRRGLSLSTLLVNSRDKKVFHQFYQKENSFYNTLCSQRNWFKAELDNYLNNEPGSEKSGCVIL